MKIRLLSWNVRGANNAEKRKIIKALMKTQRVDLVCLQKTKLKGTANEIVRSLGVGTFVDWVTLMQ